MSIEETTVDIVRISISVNMDMVDTMFKRPVNDRTLISDRVHECKNKTSRELGLVGTVGPKTMNTSSNTHGTSQDVGKECSKEPLEGHPTTEIEHHVINGIEGDDMAKGDDNSSDDTRSSHTLGGLRVFGGREAKYVILLGILVI